MVKQRVHTSVEHFPRKRGGISKLDCKKLKIRKDIPFAMNLLSFASKNKK
jgi:hypothetical protein